MNILLIGGFLPYTFSENLCNAKLVYALREIGIHVDVISQIYEGPTYDEKWKEPWLPLKTSTYEVQYQIGNKIERGWDIYISSLQMKVFPIEGIRWARRAYQKAIELHKEKRYDAILTRSPNDITHIVGYKFSKKTGVKWIANWNDPADSIWPMPYTHHFSYWKGKQVKVFTEKCLKYADITTFPSHSLLDHFIKYFPFLKEQRTEVIPHIGLSSTLIPKPNVTTYKSDKFRICHSGNLSQERNPELLFKAIRELIDEGYSNIQLDIMGHVNGYTQAMIEKYTLNDYIQFIGSYPYMEALQKMSSYDILVLVEAIMEKGIFFPSKFTDYAQLGKPILAVSPAEGFAHNMLEQYGGGIAVDNENYQSIKQGIHTLYQLWVDNSLRQKYNSQKLFANFSPQRVVSLYQTLLRC